jgi:hypothetical protein
MRSTCCQRAYEEGVKEGLRQALRDLGREQFDPFRKIGGPDSPFKPRGVPGSMYNDDR